MLTHIHPSQIQFTKYAGQSVLCIQGDVMKICVSYPVDVCYVIICTKKNGVNQNIEMLLMPVFLPAIPATFFTRPESGFGLL